MTTKQQEEALLYFNDHADDWNSKALTKNQRKVNVIQQRNGFVLSVVENRTTTKSTLDVGCGTGDLACDIARMGIDSTGVDFAPEMIEIARAKAAEEQLKSASFHCSSIFDFDLSKPRYDLIAANGFIEYISLDELERFLGLSYRALNAGGSLVLGSRNRLFNIFALNSYTLQELDGETVSLLLKEAVALTSGVSLEELADLESAPLQPANSKHTRTFIDVSTRFQFTPAQLIKLLKPHGFRVKQLYPVHIHAVSPIFKEQHPEIHTSISNLLQNYADEHVTFVPYASSFMLHVTKEC